MPQSPWKLFKWATSKPAYPASPVRFPRNQSKCQSFHNSSFLSFCLNWPWCFPVFPTHTPWQDRPFLLGVRSVINYFFSGNHLWIYWPRHIGINPKSWVHFKTTSSSFTFPFSSILPHLMPRPVQRGQGECTVPPTLAIPVPFSVLHLVTATDQGR